MVKNSGCDPNEREIDDLLLQSQGVDGRDYLSREARQWLDGLGPQLPKRFWVHQDTASDQVAGLLGTAGFVRHNRIFLGKVLPEQLESVLRHELVHLAQVQLALQTGCVAPGNLIEHEANALVGLPVALPVRYGASPYRIYPIYWFVAIGIGAYVLLRPGVANAPGPHDRTYASPSPARILGEAISIFVIPGGAFALGGRLGLGFLGSAALAGASGNVSLRAVDDIARGESSPPLMYVFDATTGAVIGFIVPGGVRLIGKAGTRALDSLATYGLRKADFALTELLAKEAARAPLTAAQAQTILQSRGLAGQVSHWWLNRRGVILLYRGQGTATDQILSPLARQEGVAASEALVARMRSFGLLDDEIAGYTARWHTERIPSGLAPLELVGQPLGAVGIPTTRLPGIAANFGEEGVIYVIRIPRNAAILPQGWQGLQLENEYVILNRVPSDSVVQMIPASRVAPLTVDDMGLLVPGGR